MKDNELNVGDPVTVEHLDLKGVIDKRVYTGRQGIDKELSYYDVIYTDDNGCCLVQRFPIEAVNRNENIADSILSEFNEQFGGKAATVDNMHRMFQDAAKILRAYASKTHEIPKMEGYYGE